jgi:DNA-binding PadR family transcriptional regulator
MLIGARLNWLLAHGQPGPGRARLPARAADASVRGGHDLRHQHKDDSVRLNFGSLYAVVESVKRRGLIAAEETRRSGRLPERTVYGLTETGRIEMDDWLTDLVSTPVKACPSFQAALSFLRALPPDDAVTLLTERVNRLESELAQATGAQELVHKKGLPRLFQVEGEFGAVLREAELGFVRQLIRDIESAALDGTPWWRDIHARADEPPWPPPLGDYVPRDEGTR